jgi:hypothetical protein
MDQPLASPKPFSLPNLLIAVGPFFLAVVTAYGASQFLQGRTQERLETIEKRQEQMVSREEMRIFMESTREDLREIKENMRALRQDLGRTAPR